jgi:hypothetical protein
MAYDLFARLYRRAADYNDIDQYISEQGWVEGFDEVVISDLLKQIYILAKNDFTVNRKKVTSNRSEFARSYGIPIRTVQDWELGNRKMPGYLKELIDYTIFVGAGHGSTN